MFKQSGDLEPLYDKFGHVLRIESTCNDIGTFRVKRKVEHRDGSSSEQKAPLKKSIYSLYQLFTIMKAANCRRLEFISSFDDHSGGKENLTKVTDSVVDKGRSYRGLNFFAERDLQALEAISRGEYMASSACRERISASILKISVRQPCPGFLNGSVFMGSSKGCRALTNISQQPMAKRSLPQDLLLETLCLYQHWHRYFSYAEILPFCVKNH